MIDNRLDDEHEALRKTVEDFARHEVAPVIAEFYERGEFPYEIRRIVIELVLCVVNEAISAEHSALPFWLFTARRTRHGAARPDPVDE